MPLRSSLARSLQYAMANMADIKTPLCALQPTPAIPHTASRSGAGTRRGGERGLEAGAGTERASRQPPAPAGLAPRARSSARGPRPPPSAAGGGGALGRRGSRSWLAPAPVRRAGSGAGRAAGPCGAERRCWGSGAGRGRLSSSPRHMQRGRGDA